MAMAQKKRAILPNSTFPYKKLSDMMMLLSVDTSDDSIKTYPSNFTFHEMRFFQAIRHVVVTWHCGGLRCVCESSFPSPFLRGKKWKKYNFMCYIYARMMITAQRSIFFKEGKNRFLFTDFNQTPHTTQFQHPHHLLFMFLLL